MWKEFFDKQETSKQTFHLTDEKSIQTDFMHQVTSLDNIQDVPKKH